LWNIAACVQLWNARTGIPALHLTRLRQFLFLILAPRQPLRPILDQQIVFFSGV
jgi:hypothetical protein